MSVNHRPPSPETRPLLAQRPTCYDSTNDVNSAVPSPTNIDLSSIDRRWMFAGLWMGVMMSAFEVTVVATLLTPIGSEFNASHRASYLGSSYLLSQCCFTLIYAKLADILGRKGSMLLALSLFGLGTMWCGVARSMSSFIAGRIVAGMGGGGVTLVTNIILTDLLPIKQRGLYQGFTNIAYGLGASLGGPIGGWANDNFGWRLVFFIQAPTLIFSFVVVAVKVNIPLSDEVQYQKLSDKLRRIDYLGAITLAGATVCLLLAIDIGTAEMRWTHPLVMFLAASSAFFAFSFIMTEKYWATHPTMPLRLLLQRGPLAVSLSSFLLSMSVFSMLYSAPVFFSIVRSHSSAVTGRYLLPHSIAVSMGSICGGWYMRTTGKLYWLTLQAALLVLLPSVLASLWSQHTPEYRLWLDILPQGFGFSCFITTTLIAVIASVRREDIPISTGMTYLFRQTGQATGVSLGGAVLQYVLRKRLRARIHGPGSEEIIYSIQHSAQIIPSLEPQIRHAAVESYADALRVVFICQAAFGLLGFIACLPIQENLEPSPDPQPAEERGSSQDGSE